MIKAIAVVSVALLLAACERSPEYMEEHADPRIVASAERLCEPHDGIYRYWLKNLAGADPDRPHVECFDQTRYNIRSEEEV